MKTDFIVYKIFSKGDELEKKLLEKHLFAILILLIMVVSTYLIITDIISTQKDGAELINKSGKQRMLTQRVLAFYYQNELHSAIQIEQAFQSLEKNNKTLLEKLKDKRSISYEDQFLHNIFYKKDGIINTFELYKQSILQNERVPQICRHLFNLYDTATLHYENRLKNEVKNLLIYETIILIVSIITIILEGFFIFRPALIEVYRKHKELKELNTTLDQKVKDQIDHIREQEQTLIQQSKMAEMGEMLSDISHQWKQPLTILSLQLDTIQTDVNDNRISKEQIGQDLSECFKLIRHMHQTIEDFKNFYKPDTDKKLFNTAEAIEEVIKMEKTSLYRHTIELIFEKEDEADQYTIVGFEGQFKQVILTLVNNAIEQISNNITHNIQEKNSGKITIKLFKNQDKLFVQVQDNAGGIDSKIIDKIFNPYFSTKHDTGGSGIGLYMAKTILEKNFQGKLTAKNIKGGASFEILL